MMDMDLRDRINKSLTNHTPDITTITHIEMLRKDAKTFGSAIAAYCPPGRERSLAVTKLEEAVMWAVKSMVLPVDP